MNSRLTSSENTSDIPSQLFENQEWLTTEEAAQYLRTTKKIILNESSNGNIPYYKFGRRNRYLKSELRKLLLDSRRGVQNGN